MGILLMEENVPRLRLSTGCGHVTSRLHRSSQNPSGSTSLSSVYNACLLVTEPHLLCSGSDIRPYLMSFLTTLNKRCEADIFPSL